MKKRILIFGAGVIGSTYGGLMALTGHDVTLLARNKRLEEIRQQGLLLQRVKQNVPHHISVKVISELKDNETYDYIFVTLRKEQVIDALSILSKNKSQNIVFMVNNPSGYAEWINCLGENRVIPAFPGSGGKIEDGIVHYEIVSKFIQPTTLGEFNGEITPRIKELELILTDSGFHVSISKNMDGWQKSHIAMVAPLGDVIYFDGGNNYTVSRNQKAIEQMNLSLKENFRFLHQSGIGIEPFKLNIFRFLPVWLLNITMKYVYNTKWAEKVISNHALNARQEMITLTEDFLELANSKGFVLNELRKLKNEKSKKE